MRRTVLAIAILIASCGGESSLSTYANDVETLATAMNATLDRLDEEHGSIGTLAEARDYAAARVAARRDFLAGMEGVEVPPSVFELHDEAIEIIRLVTNSESAMAARVESAGSLDELGNVWDTPEGVAAREADDRLILLCEAAQDTFDKTASGGELEDVPWIPQEMKQVIQVAFGCRAEDR